MYVLIRGVVSKRHTLLSPSSTTSATALLLMTIQCRGAVTVNVNAALRSGWSKQA
jgi:hypothetical protein